MENKKQLVIIPPMSEAVKKLQEVLEGIAVDENIEITIIDNLKELNQFLGSTGQCIILASNAKKCASFLQENRLFLLKHHCKTILFTPKEIPSKTLAKFTKIGLTESILENSPPKTLLYKVKLLLRSIKTAKPISDAEKTVKSLDNNKITEGADLEIKGKIAAEENVIDMERPNKKSLEEGETIDYGNPLKGTTKNSEENLDTHWKSDRKKSEIAFAEEEKDLAVDSTPDAIDMYMRGKNKNPNELIVEEDDFDKKMAELLAAEEEAKKKNAYADVIDEGSMKQKRLNEKEQNVEKKNEKISIIDLDLLSADKNANKQDDTPDEESEEEDEFDKMMAELLEAEAKKKNAGFAENLGGHLKGKVSTNIPIEEKEETNLKREYDNSLVNKEKEKTVELNLLAANKKRETKDLEAQEEGKVHEGQVDQIEGGMIGNEGTVDKIRTRMEGKSNQTGTPSEDNNEDLYADGKKALLKEVESKQDSSANELGNEELESETKKREALRSESEEKNYKENSVELELLHADKKTLNKEELPENESRERKNIDSVATNERNNKATEKNIKDEKTGHQHTTSEEKAKELGNNVHNSKVDKIDTFYRGGEAAKSKTQSWDNLIDKKASLDLLPEKGKRADTSQNADSKSDLGEQTIDYRKLKAEFDMIAGGRSTDSEEAKTASGAASLKSDDDEGSFKVVEIDPKSLDFSISIINSIYQKETKPKKIFALLADELVNNYHCYPLFYTYRLSDKKFNEIFNTFVEIKDERVTEEKMAFWNEFKKDALLFDHFYEKSITTWRCPEIVKNDEVWEDVELPSWAETELKSKKVELIFPYFDGLDRMGMAVVLFPDGLDPKSAAGLLTVLEMARTLFLDTIQRYQVQPLREDRRALQIEETSVNEYEKKNVLSFFGGFFGKKKTG